MHQHFFFASHSLETLAKRLAQQLEVDLFAPPLIIIPHPCVKEWLQLELSKQTGKAVIGLEFFSWRSALQNLVGPLPVPTPLEMSAALCPKTEWVEVYSQHIDGFCLADEEKTTFEKLNQLHGWKTIPQALAQTSIPHREVILFAIDFLPPAVHQFFLQLPNLQVYRFSPCAMFWEDFCSASEKKRMLRAWDKKGASASRLQTLDDFLRDSQRLLANWGMIGRKMLLDHDMETDYELGPPDTLLNALKLDLLFFEKPTSFAPDLSIQCVKTGASRFQEVQWVKEEVCRLGYPLSEIRVYAPDITLYAPIIEFTFDTIPFRMPVDLGRQSGFYQAIVQLFRLVKGRWEAGDLLELFQKPAFHQKQKWKPEDVERMRDWIEMGRIRWGIDSAHKQQTTDVGTIRPTTGSWENGWNEMVDSLVYFQPEKKAQMSWSEMELLESFYATFHRLQTSLLSWREDKTLATWASEIETFIQETLEPDESAANALTKFLDGLRKTGKAFPTETFPFTWVETTFASTPAEEGASLLHALRFSSLTPGAILPAKVIFLLGMDEESFPRSSFAPTLAKDAPSPSDFDRYTLLQTIFCAKERLIFSYGDRSKEDGKAVSPSLLVQELLSYLGTESHVNGTVVKPLYMPRPSLLSNTPSIPEVTQASVVPKELAKFFRHPPQYYLTEVLGIDPRKEPESHWKEFSLSGLDRHLLLKQSLEHTTSNIEMPLGLFGELAKKNLHQDIAEYQEHLQGWGIEAISPEELAVPGGVLHLGADDIGGLFRKWPELLAVLQRTQTHKIFCLRTGRIREVVDPDTALQCATHLFLRCQKSPCFLHAEWVDALLRKNNVPDLDQTKDPILKWILQRSPGLDLDKERAIWDRFGQRPLPR